MVFDVVILPGVYTDTTEAYSYYEHLSSGLAKKFYDEFLKCLGELKKHPQFYGLYNSEFRRIQFLKFPYTLIFKIA